MVDRPQYAGPPASQTPTTPPDEEFPCYLYVYNDAGFHDGKLKIPDKPTLTRVFAEIVTPAVRAGKQVIITDAMDFCSFHAEGGEVIFPTPDHIAQMSGS